MITKRRINVLLVLLIAMALFASAGIFAAQASSTAHAAPSYVISVESDAGDGAYQTLQSAFNYAEGKSNVVMEVLDDFQNSDANDVTVSVGAKFDLNGKVVDLNEKMIDLKTFELNVFDTSEGTKGKIMTGVDNGIFKATAEEPNVPGKVKFVDASVGVRFDQNLARAIFNSDEYYLKKVVTTVEQVTTTEYVVMKGTTPVLNKTQNLGYATIADAVADAATGDELQVNVNLTEAENVTVAKNTELTVDLNGKTLSGALTVAAEAATTPDVIGGITVTSGAEGAAISGNITVSGKLALAGEKVAYSGAIANSGKLSIAKGSFSGAISDTSTGGISITGGVFREGATIASTANTKFIKDESVTEETPNGTNIYFFNTDLNYLYYDYTKYHLEVVGGEGDLSTYYHFVWGGIKVLDKTAKRAFDTLKEAFAAVNDNDAHTIEYYADDESTADITVATGRTIKLYSIDSESVDHNKNEVVKKIIVNGTLSIYSGKFSGAISVTATDEITGTFQMVYTDGSMSGGLYATNYPYTYYDYENYHMERNADSNHAGYFGLKEGPVAAYNARTLYGYGEAKLNEAITDTDAEAGDTIVLRTDVKDVVIAPNKVMTIDLNGFDVSEEENDHALKVAGEGEWDAEAVITIINSYAGAEREAEVGKISNAGSLTLGGFGIVYNKAISNTHKLTVNGGIFEAGAVITNDGADATVTMIDTSITEENVGGVNIYLALNNIPYTYYNTALYHIERVGGTGDFAAYYHFVKGGAAAYILRTRYTYYTVADAIADAKDSGDTIVLLNIVSDVVINTTKTFTLDINGWTIMDTDTEEVDLDEDPDNDNKDALTIVAGTVTLTNGSDVPGIVLGNVTNNATLTLKGTGLALNILYEGDVINSENATLTINGGIFGGFLYQGENKIVSATENFINDESVTEQQRGQNIYFLENNIQYTYYNYAERHIEATVVNYGNSEFNCYCFADGGIEAIIADTGYGYYTLNEAVAAIVNPTEENQTAQTIRLMKNIDAETLEFDNGNTPKTYNIDLYGKNITATEGFINKTDTITIVNTAVDEEEKPVYSTVDAKITNCATLTLEGVAVNYEKTIASGNDNAPNAKLYVNGGVFNADLPITSITTLFIEDDSIDEENTAGTKIYFKTDAVNSNYYDAGSYHLEKVGGEGAYKDYYHLVAGGSEALIVETGIAYATLNDAIAALENTAIQTVRLLKNVSDVEISAEKTFILDLNGKTISDSFVDENTDEIDDDDDNLCLSVAGSTNVTITSGIAGAVVSGKITNAAKLTLAGVNVTYSDTITSVENATLTINGGVFKKEAVINSTTMPCIEDKSIVVDGENPVLKGTNIFFETNNVNFTYYNYEQYHLELVGGEGAYKDYYRLAYGEIVVIIVETGIGYGTLDEAIQAIVDPTTEEEPTVDDPIVDEPIVDEPIVDDPIEEEPTVQTIRMMANLKDVVIDTTKTFKLDLNGYYIVDTMEDVDGDQNDDNLDALTIVAGNVTLLNSDVDLSQIDGNVTNGGTLTLTGTGTEKTIRYLSDLTNNENATLTINGGLFYGYDGCDIVSGTSNFIVDESITEVTDGKNVYFSVNNVPYTYYDYQHYHLEATQITLYGNDFDCYHLAKGGIVAIIVETNVGYGTITEAVAAVDNDQTLLLLANVSDVVINNDKTFTFDLNGHTISDTFEDVDEDEADDNTYALTIIGLGTNVNVISGEADAAITGDVLLGSGTRVVFGAKITTQNAMPTKNGKAITVSGKITAEQGGRLDIYSGTFAAIDTNKPTFVYDVTLGDTDDAHPVFTGAIEVKSQFETVGGSFTSESTITVMVNADMRIFSGSFAGSIRVLSYGHLRIELLGDYAAPTFTGDILNNGTLEISGGVFEGAITDGPQDDDHQDHIIGIWSGVFKATSVITSADCMKFIFKTPFSASAIFEIDNVNYTYYDYEQYHLGLIGGEGDYKDWYHLVDGGIEAIIVDTNVGYGTIKEAVAAVVDPTEENPTVQTVKLMKNVSDVVIEGEEVTVEEITTLVGKQFKLDLNGKTISDTFEDANEDEEDDDDYAITVKAGTVTIINSIDENGKFDFMNVTEDATVIIDGNVQGTVLNQGNLTVTTGTIGSLENKGTATLDGGEFGDILNNATLTIAGGNYNGQITDKKAATAEETDPAPVLSITGGYFYNEIAIAESLNKKFISGEGTAMFKFNTVKYTYYDYEAYHFALVGGDGDYKTWYHLVEGGIEAINATTGIGYYKVADAVAAVVAPTQENPTVQTIRLMKNVSDLTIFSEKMFIFDLNGKTISDTDEDVDPVALDIAGTGTMVTVVSTVEGATIAGDFHNLDNVNFASEYHDAVNDTNVPYENVTVEGEFVAKDESNTVIQSGIFKGLVIDESAEGKFDITGGVFDYDGDGFGIESGNNVKFITGGYFKSNKVRSTYYDAEHFHLEKVGGEGAYKDYYQLVEGGNEAYIKETGIAYGTLAEAIEAVVNPTEENPTVQTVVLLKDVKDVVIDAITVIDGETEITIAKEFYFNLNGKTVSDTFEDEDEDEEDDDAYAITVNAGTVTVINGNADYASVTGEILNNASLTLKGANVVYSKPISDASASETGFFSIAGGIFEGTAVITSDNHTAFVTGGYFEKNNVKYTYYNYEEYHFAPVGGNGDYKDYLYLVAGPIDAIIVETEIGYYTVTEAANAIVNPTEENTTVQTVKLMKNVSDVEINAEKTFYLDLNGKTAIDTFEDVDEDEQDDDAYAITVNAGTVTVINKAVENEVPVQATVSGAILNKARLTLAGVNVTYGAPIESGANATLTINGGVFKKEAVINSTTMPCIEDKSIVAGEEVAEEDVVKEGSNIYFEINNVKYTCYDTAKYHLELVGGEGDYKTYYRFVYGPTIAVINELYGFGSVEDALKAVSAYEDHVIKLLADNEEGVLEVTTANVTLDLNGKTLTVEKLKVKKTGFVMTGGSLKKATATVAPAAPTNDFGDAVIEIDAEVGSVTIHNATIEGGVDVPEGASLTIDGTSEIDYVDSKGKVIVTGGSIEELAIVTGEAVVNGGEIEYLVIVDTDTENDKAVEITKGSIKKMVIDGGKVIINNPEAVFKGDNIEDMIVIGGTDDENPPKVVISNGEFYERIIKLADSYANVSVTGGNFSYIISSDLIETEYAVYSHSEVIDQDTLSEVLRYTVTTIADALDIVSHDTTGNAKIVLAKTTHDILTDATFIPDETVETGFVKIQKTDGMYYVLSPVEYAEYIYGLLVKEDERLEKTYLYDENGENYLAEYLASYRAKLDDIVGEIEPAIEAIKEAYDALHENNADYTVNEAKRALKARRETYADYKDLIDAVYNTGMKEMRRVLTAYEDANKEIEAARVSALRDLRLYAISQGISYYDDGLAIYIDAIENGFAIEEGDYVYVEDEKGEYVLDEDEYVLADAEDTTSQRYSRVRIYLTVENVNKQLKVAFDVVDELAQAKAVEEAVEAYVNYANSILDTGVTEEIVSYDETEWTGEEYNNEADDPYDMHYLVYDEEDNTVITGVRIVTDAYGAFNATNIGLIRDAAFGKVQVALAAAKKSVDDEFNTRKRIALEGAQAGASASNVFTSAMYAAINTATSLSQIEEAKAIALSELQQYLNARLAEIDNAAIILEALGVEYDNETGDLIQSIKARIDALSVDLLGNGETGETAIVGEIEKAQKAINESIAAAKAVIDNIYAAIGIDATAAEYDTVSDLFTALNTAIATAKGELTTSIGNTKASVEKVYAAIGIDTTAEEYKTVAQLIAAAEGKVDALSVELLGEGEAAGVIADAKDAIIEALNTAIATAKGELTTSIGNAKASVEKVYAAIGIDTTAEEYKTVAQLIATAEGKVDALNVELLGEGEAAGVIADAKDAIIEALNTAIATAKGELATSIGNTKASVEKVYAAIGIDTTAEEYKTVAQLIAAAEGKVDALSVELLGEGEAAGVIAASKASIEEAIATAKAALSGEIDALKTIAQNISITGTDHTAILNAIADTQTALAENMVDNTETITESIATAKTEIKTAVTATKNALTLKLEAATELLEALRLTLSVEEEDTALNMLLAAQSKVDAAVAKLDTSLLDENTGAFAKQTADIESSVTGAQNSVEDVQDYLSETLQTKVETDNLTSVIDTAVSGMAMILAFICLIVLVSKRKKGDQL